MTSKERVLKTFYHEKPDRVPIDYFTNYTIFLKTAKLLGVTSYEDVIKAFNVDFRNIYVPYTGKCIYPQKEGLRVDPVYGFYTRWVDNEYGGYDDFCAFPLKEASEETIYNFPIPSADDFDYSGVYDFCQANKEYAIVCGDAGMSDIINATGRVMGMEDTLINLLTEDEATLDYISRRCDMELKKLERIIKASKGGVDYLMMGEDLGTQHKPMISMDMYRRVLKPFHQRYIDLAKAYKLPVMIHTCGSSSWVYNELIDMGVWAVDTLQPEAAYMDPKYLVDNFGGRLSFKGCISTAGSLAFGNEEDIENEVRDVLDIMKPTYSYMLSPTHAIQDNTPPENILRMYKAAIEYGKY